MEAIYYIAKESGDAFKLVILSEDEDDVNFLLDDLNMCVDRYITAEEFDAACGEQMTLDVMDAEGERTIAELTCEKFDLEGE